MTHQLEVLHKGNGDDGENRRGGRAKGGKVAHFAQYTPKVGLGEHASDTRWDNKHRNGCPGCH